MKHVQILPYVEKYMLLGTILCTNSTKHSLIDNVNIGINI